MEKKFDIKEAFIVKLKNNLDKEEENLSPKDKKFFNLSIIMDVGRLSQKFSYECEECQANKDKLLELTEGMADALNTYEGRKRILKQLDKITTHLRKKHKMYIRRYISSFIIMIMLLGAILIGLVYGYFSGSYKMPLLIGGGFALIMGSVVGGIYELILQKKGQIYGK